MTTTRSYSVLSSSQLVGHDPLSVALIDETQRDGEDDEVEPAAPGCCCTGISQRYVLAALLHTGLAVCYAMRVGMSVAAAPPAALHDNATIPINATMFTQYHWSNTDEGIVLGSFFQGYILTQTISAVLARRFGGKAVLAASMATGCALTWATPIVAGRLAELVSCRTWLGIAQGAAYPATLTLVAKWYTPRERASFLGFIIAGPYLGEALTFPLAALVMDSSSLGWPFVFYFLAIIGAVWLLLFLCLASSSPDTHPRISYAEQVMLRRALAPEASKTHSRRCVVSEKPAACSNDVDVRDAQGQERCLLQQEKGEEERAATAAAAAAGRRHEASAGTRVDDSLARRDRQESIPQEVLRGVDCAADVAGAARRGGEAGGSMVVVRGRSGEMVVVDFAGDSESEDSVDRASESLDGDGRAGGAAQWERGRAAASDPGIPWGAILGCKAAWACWIGHTVYSWNFYTLLTQLPSILSLLLHLDGENAGMIMSMSYVLMLISSVLSGIAADCILASNGVSTCAVRKAAEVISVLVPSVLLYVASQALTESAAVVLLIAAFTCMGCCSAGHHTNYLEISTSLSGILMGIGNTITCLSGIAGPIVTGALVDVFGCTQQAPDKCRAAYGAVNLIGVGVSAAGTLVFLVWGTSKRVLDY